MHFQAIPEKIEAALQNSGVKHGNKIEAVVVA